VEAFVTTSSTPAPSEPGFALLVGEWRGRGVADFPTIDRAEYDEDLRIEWDEGRGVFCYDQRATLANGSPSHRELGFISILDDGGVRLWNTQNNGRTEVLSGSSSWDPDQAELRIDLSSVEFGNDPRMLESHRILTVREGSLAYQLAMSTTTTAEPDRLVHLACELVQT